MPLVRNVRVFTDDANQQEAGVRFGQPILGTDVQQLATVLSDLKRSVKYRNLDGLVNDALIVFNGSDFAKRKNLIGVSAQPVADWDYEIKL